VIARPGDPLLTYDRREIAARFAADCEATNGVIALGGGAEAIADYVGGPIRIWRLRTPSTDLAALASSELLTNP
jgi:hypothetical protein